MIPKGTTSRQLATLCRWTLATVLIAGALSWWWPSARSWGAMAGGLLVVFVLWVAWKTSRGDSAAPASPFHLALAGPAVIWSAHFLRHSLLPGHEVLAESVGTLDISEIYQLGLLALSATLTQDLFASRRGRDLPVLLCGTGMVVGALAATSWGKVLPLGQSMNLLAFAGVSLWVSVLYSKGQRPPETRDATLVSRHPRRDPVRVAALAAIAVMFAALLALFPAEGLLAAGMLVAIAMLGQLFVRRARWGASVAVFFAISALLAGAWGLSIWLAGFWTPWRDFASALARESRGWSAMGSGGGAFARLTGLSSGLEFLGDAIGWVGMAYLGAAGLAAVAWALWRARGGGEGAATIFRLWAACLATAALLAPSGEFVPSVTLAVGFTWGLLFARPANTELGAPPHFRLGNRVASPLPSPILSGWVLVGLSSTLVLFLALSPDEGLAGWSGKSLGLGPTFLHVSCGFLVALVFAWQTGCRRVWKGLLGIAVAIAAGGAGELSQLLTTTRHARFTDFLLTSSGCLAAAVPYLLARGARMCEED
jgi:hypothetical protein